MEETSKTKYPEEKELKTLTIKEMNPEDQPREKAEKLGCGALTVSELWAILLRVGTPGMPVTELCRKLMEENDNSLHKLERRTLHQIMELKGLGKAKAIQVMAALELIKRYCKEEIPDDEPIRSSQDIFKRMQFVIGNLDHEEIWVIYLNRRNQVLKQIQVTTGTSTASIFDIKKIIKLALLENAESVAMCHNHPSGNTKPSPQDDQITKALADACKFLNLQMLDHVIVTANSYFSYRDSGRL